MDVGPALLTSPDDVIAIYGWREQVAGCAMVLEVLGLVGILVARHPKINWPLKKALGAIAIDLTALLGTAIYWAGLREKLQPEREVIKLLAEPPLRLWKPGQGQTFRKHLTVGDMLEGEPTCYLDCSVLREALQDKNLRVDGQDVCAYTIYRARLIHLEKEAKPRTDPTLRQLDSESDRGRRMTARAKRLFWEGFQTNPNCQDRWEDAKARLEETWEYAWYKKITDETSDAELKAVIWPE